MHQETTHIPKLRFPEFEGEWAITPFRDLLKINQGLQIAIDQRYTNEVENSFFYITNEFLRSGNSTRYFIKNPPENVLCKEHDILMTRTGNTGQVVTGVTGAFHNNFFKIKYPDSISKDFLVEFLRKNETQNLILRYAGTSTIPDLNHSDFYRIKFTCPKLPEQQKIASFLTKVDQKIDLLQRKKDQLTAYKKGMMQKLFPATGRQVPEIRFKDDQGNNFPDWEEKKLGEVMKIQTGKKDVNEGNPDGIYPFFTCAKTPTFSDDFSFEGAAVLVAGNGEVGHCQKYNGRFEAYQRTYVLSDFSESFEYIFIVMTGLFKRHVDQQTQMGAMPYIKLGTLRDFIIPIAHPTEQQKIADFLTAFDRKIDLVTQKLTQAQTFKKGLLQQMFV